MVSMKSRESEYLYLGLGIIAVLILVGLASTNAALPDSGDSTVQASFALQTNGNTYHAAVSEEALFSAEPVALLFSSTRATGKENIQCSINCVKTK